MKKTRIFCITVLAIGIFLTTGVKSFARVKIGLIDMPRILQNYEEAKKAQANLESNRTTLKKMIVEAKKEIKSIKDDEQKKEREKKLTKEILEKNKVFRESFSKKWEKVQNNILITIKKVADDQELDLVMDKKTVIAGGNDITDNVLKELKK